MKYPTKVDRWLAILMAVSALIPVCIAVFSFLSQGARSEAAWIATLIVVLTAGVVAVVSFPTYYEVQSDKLVIRSGMLRWTVRLDEIISVTPTSSALSSPAWSLDRLEVRSSRAGKERTLLISPKQRDEFLQELRSKASTLALEGNSLRKKQVF